MDVVSGRDIINLHSDLDPDAMLAKLNTASEKNVYIGYVRDTLTNEYLAAGHIGCPDPATATTALALLQKGQLTPTANAIQREVDSLNELLDRHVRDEGHGLPDIVHARTKEVLSVCAEREPRSR